ncbi:MAG: nitroreductase family protein [Candidatus Asgardarchaeia archaeon]|nr:MAG: nitroreductase family protein [Candidatus Asgardarchaeum californiense]
MFNEKDKKLLHRFLKTRRTIRKFLDRPVPKETIAKIIETATWAPSAHNRQPWFFVVITNSTTKRRLAEEMAKKYMADLKADGFPSRLIKSRVASSIKRITSAPVVIVPCLVKSLLDKYPDDERNMAEYIMGVQSVAAAIQTLLLAAYAEGLGTCWRCAPLFTKEIVRRVLSLPEDYEPQALIEMGYYKKRPVAPERKPLEEIIRWIE